MEIKTKSKSKSSPLTDVTNINLIPISTLHKLCEYNKKPSNNFTRNLITEKNSRNSKPFDASSTASSAKKGSDNAANSSSNCSSKSDTSIGSSNFNHNANTAVEFTGKTRRVAPPLSPPLGDGGSQHVYIRRQTDEKTKRAREAVSLSSDSGTLEKTDDKVKAIIVPSSRLIPFENAKDKGKAMVIPSVSSDSSLLDKTNDKGKSITVPSSGFIPLKNTKDKCKAIAAPSDNHASVTRSYRGKAVPIPPSCPQDKTEDKGKSIVMHPTHLSPHKTEEKVMKVVAAFCCPPLPKSRSMRKGSSEAGQAEPPKLWTDGHPKRRKKRCIRQKANPENSLPPDFVEQQRAYYREVDEFELPEEEISSYEMDKEE